MKTSICIALVLLATVAAITALGSGRSNHHLSLTPVASAATPGACTLPTTAPDPNNATAVAQTAWQLFIAVNCQANKTQLVWETWTEQLDLYTRPGTVAGKKPNRLHGSPLAMMLAAKLRGTKALPQLNPNDECQPMGAPPSNMPNSQAPTHAGQFCEEVHIDPTAVAYITQNGYQFRVGQVKAVTSSTTINFPQTAVEVKADWIPATDFSPAQFNCTNPPQGIHVEMIDGNCYALAAMHISSKLLPDWIWATFEPQNLTTNPQRCSTSLYGPCDDPFGSNPASSSGQSTQLTPALSALMTQAGLAPEFLNYRLDAAQVLFGTKQNPTLLGNSVTEGEAVGLPKGTASCITCHSTSAINGAGAENPNIGGVGPQPTLPSGYIARDFAWSLGEACPDSVFNSNPNCVTSGAAKQKKK